MVRRPKLDLSALEAALGHSFADRALLERALTHVSALAQDDARTDTYQRLEFLGDRVLGLAVSDMLYATFPDAHEGELSRRLADLVRRESCAEVATAWGAGPFIAMGVGEAQTGGRKKHAILGDVCEALIGAVFLDAGFETAQRVVQIAWRARMMAPTRPLRDAKTSLQEWAQARGLPTPVYKEVSRIGPEHAPQFCVAVEIVGFAPADAYGASKRVAEQAAAKAFMDREHVGEVQVSPTPAEA